VPGSKICEQVLRRSQRGFLNLAAVPDRPLDPSTVEECHLAFSKMLENYAWALVRDRALAADVVQTSFLALSRFGGDVAAESRKGWLFRVVHREAIKVRNRSKPYSQSGTEAENTVLEARASYEISPLSRMVEQENLESLKRMIADLPRDQQKVLEMKFFENKTFAEIADLMQTPIGTALSRMRLALERLRTATEEKEDWRQN
jgi:RNA polymerase sigma-70 factor (ECF subfamily)